MIQIEYQLTFEEFQEGMSKVRRQIARRTRKDTRGKRSVVVIASWVCLFLGWIYLWPILTGGGRRRPRAIAPRDLPDQLWPHLFWISVLVVFFVMIVVLARRQFGRQVSRMWEEVPHLRQMRRVRFDDDGVTLQHALLQCLTRWPMYQRLEETPRVFLLCASDYNADIYPKRAFPGSLADEFRRMVKSQLAERVRAFPVLPIEPETTAKSAPGATP